jgi:membrane-bound serine protease (ClpP class)
MKFRRLLHVAVLLLLTSLSLPPTAVAKFSRISLNGAIDPITAEFVVRGISQAEADQSTFVLIRLQTPGGFASSMEEIIEKMLNSKVPVIVYVTPSGAKAASAGFFILMAGDVAVMSPGTNTGAAHPLMAIGGFPVDGGEAGKTLTEKITSNASAFLRSIAVKRNRNVDEAGKAVTDSKSFTDSEALEKGLVDIVASDEVDLLRRLDGFKVRMFSGQERALRTAGETGIDMEMTARQKFLSTISQPNLALLLGIAGLILLYFEFTHPGAIAPGVIGGISLLLSILGFSFLPINYVGVLLILLAIGLFVAEVKVQSFGVLGLGGVAAMVMGIIILVDTPDPALRISLKTALFISLPFAVLFIGLMMALIRSMRQKVTTGESGMIGLLGTADTDIHESGRVKVRGEYWSARSAEPILSGTAVKITALKDLTLTVMKAGNQ